MSTSEPLCLLHHNVLILILFSSYPGQWCLAITCCLTGTPSGSSFHVLFFGVETVLGVKTIVETVEATVLAFTSLLVDPKIPTIHSFVGVNTFAAIS